MKHNFDVNDLEVEERETLMCMLTENTELTHDGGCDDRLFLNDSYHINIFASDMTEKEYKKMESLLNTKTINGKGYTVYAWNDSSGYKYWSRDHYESNYIQVTVTIHDPDSIDIKKMNEDAKSLFNFFAHYDNAETHDFSRRET